MSSHAVSSHTHAHTHVNAQQLRLYLRAEYIDCDFQALMRLGDREIAHIIHELLEKHQLTELQVLVQEVGGRGDVIGIVVIQDGEIAFSARSKDTAATMEIFLNPENGKFFDPSNNPILGFVAGMENTILSPGRIHYSFNQVCNQVQQ